MLGEVFLVGRGSAAGAVALLFLAEPVEPAVPVPSGAGVRCVGARSQIQAPEWISDRAKPGEEQPVKSAAPASAASHRSGGDRRAGGRRRDLRPRAGVWRHGLGLPVASRPRNHGVPGEREAPGVSGLGAAPTQRPRAGAARAALPGQRWKRAGRLVKRRRGREADPPPEPPGPGLASANIC